MADPLVEGRSLVVEAIRALTVACRTWAAYPSDHPNVTQAVGTAQARLAEMLASHGSIAIGVARAHLRVGVWTLDSPQARALAQALYRRQAAVLRIERGIEPAELRALVQWLAGPAVPLEPGSPAAGPPGLPRARHLQLQPLDYSAVRLTDHAEAASAQPSISLTDRLLNVLLEWGPGDADWIVAETTTGAVLPAELAMVSWLRSFLEAQAGLERGATADRQADAGIDGVGGTGTALEPAQAGDSQERMTSLPGDAAGASEDDGSQGHGAGVAGSTVAAGENGSAERRGVVSGQAPDSGSPGVGGTPVPAGWPTTLIVGPPPSGSVASPAYAGDTGALWSGVSPRQLLVRLTNETAAHLKELSGPGRILAARQTAQLIMRLPEPLRESLMRAALRVVATDPAGEDALQAFTSSLTPHPVLRVMSQLAAEGVPLSRHAQRLIELLASTLAEAEEADASASRDLEVLRGELLTLFRDEDIDRYNPEDHVALLAGAMLAWPTRTPVILGTLDTLGERVASLTEDAVSRQLTATLLDLLERYTGDKTEPVLSRLAQLVQGALARGSLDEAARAIESMVRMAQDETVPEPTRATIRDHLDQLAQTETLSVLGASLGATPGPAAVRLIQHLGPAAIRSLVHVLVDEQVRVRRRRIFDLLTALGPDVVPEAMRWLGDANWYIVRNMIALLRAVGDRSSLATIRRLTRHSDLRVRLEALRSLLELDATSGQRYLVDAIADPDPRAAIAAVELAGRHGGQDMVEPLLAVLAPWDLRGRRRSVRLAALQALGRVGRAEALPRLARFFRERWGLLPAVAERRAAYASLEGYPSEARAGLVTLGLRSRDQEIRAISERLRRAE